MTQEEYTNFLKRNQITLRPIDSRKEYSIHKARAEEKNLIESFNALEDTLTVLLALHDSPAEREKVEEELLLAFAQFRTILENF